MIDLPREIWELVLGELTSEQQRPLLAVNRLLHSFALHSLFHLIHIYLGAFESIHPTLNDSGDASELDAQALTRSLDILGGIIQDKTFAAVVRTVVVHAYVKEGENVSDHVWGEEHHRLHCLIAN
jgi:hypothetical protein